MPVPCTSLPMQVPVALVLIVVDWPGSNVTLPFAGCRVTEISGAGRLSQFSPKPAMTKTRARRPATTGSRRTPSSGKACVAATPDCDPGDEQAVSKRTAARSPNVLRAEFGVKGRAGLSFFPAAQCATCAWPYHGRPVPCPEKVKRRIIKDPALLKSGHSRGDYCDR